eukprot:4103570-Prorocentrum_lima.AAC.1
MAPASRVGDSGWVGGAARTGMLGRGPGLGPGASARWRGRPACVSERARVRSWVWRSCNRAAST